MRESEAISGMQPDQLEQLVDPLRDRFVRVDETEGADRLGDDALDPPARVEARVGVLEDHVDPAPKPLQLRRAVGIGERDSVDPDPPRGRRKKADHHACDRGLAGAGLADESEGPCTLDLERHVVDRLEVAPRLAGEGPG